MNAPPSPRPAPVEFDDVQGVLRFGYKHLPQASFVLLRVRERAAARDWLAQAEVSSALTRDPPPETALQVALTREGLRALGVAPDVVESFSAEFVAGLGGDVSRARRLGDAGASAPAQWAWGTDDRTPHLLLLLYARAGHLQAFERAVLQQCAAGFETIASLDTCDLDGVEPFGFVDGISQPEVDWQRRRAARDASRLDYDNLTCLGEFLLGYPNEYGGYTERPLLDPRRPSAALLPLAEDDRTKADLGRNGSYLVLRQLRQDVAGFWQFLDRRAGGDAALRRRWAEAMVGRTLDGTPLVAPGAGAARTGAADALDRNAFTYRDDPAGRQCPLGAHVRRANPRNGDLPAGRDGLLGRLLRRLGFDADGLQRDRVASTRFHRLLRRGREYGPPLSLDEALGGASPGDDRGLHFICLGASLARQFEFVQGAWLAAHKFDGLDRESDPLLGWRLPQPDGTRADAFSMPQAGGPDRRLAGLPDFVTVVGGAYFFLPGLRALRYLASAPVDEGAR